MTDSRGGLAASLVRLMIPPNQRVLTRVAILGCFRFCAPPSPFVGIFRPVPPVAAAARRRGPGDRRRGPGDASGSGDPGRVLPHRHPGRPGGQRRCLPSRPGLRHRRHPARGRPALERHGRGSDPSRRRWGYGAPALPGQAPRPLPEPKRPGPARPGPPVPAPPARAGLVRPGPAESGLACSCTTGSGAASGTGKARRRSPASALIDHTAPPFTGVGPHRPHRAAVHRRRPSSTTPDHDWPSSVGHPAGLPTTGGLWSYV